MVDAIYHRISKCRKETCQLKNQEQAMTTTNMMDNVPTEIVASTTTKLPMATEAIEAQDDKTD